MTENFTNAQSGETTRILLVDDHNDLLTMLELVLSRRSFAVATATSGAEALAKVEDFAPHVVVSDLGMPGMNGLQMMEQLRRMSGVGPFKAIALSGFDDASDAAEAISAGFDAHLPKPIDFEHLFATIERLMD